MIDINCRADLSGNLYQFCLDYTLKMEDNLCVFFLSPDGQEEVTEFIYFCYSFIWAERTNRNLKISKI